ncbi:MAG: hypothetical protein HYW56_01395 [Candidatus Harrisonbacteria bacterium]|nr:hypothetical protein [Candidatus Harrisonbacteria bacterium]
MANEPNEPAKPEVQDLRDVPPVDARDRMWRAVKLYAALAGMLLAAWGLLLLTAWVYKQPPPMPVTPQEQTIGELKYDMSRHDAYAVMRKYDPGVWSPVGTDDGTECYALGQGLWEIRGDSRGLTPTPFGWVGDDKRSKVVRWRWTSNYSGADDGQWIAELWLSFYDNKLADFHYDYWRETGKVRLYKRDVPLNRASK